MEKIIEIGSNKFKVTPELVRSSCTGCSLFDSEDGGCYANKLDITFNTGDCYNNNTIVVRVDTDEYIETKPTIQMNLELDLSNCILPVFFTVKNLRLQSLDTALKNQSDAYNISVKDLPQETIEMLAEGIKREFIKRNTKVLS